MSKTNVKNIVATATSTTTTTSVPAINSTSLLTVVVLDDKGLPISGAHVSITPSDASVVTKSNGEAQFNLGASLKYNVKVTAGSDIVTVPYYLTPDGATRLIVNVAYVKTIEQQLHQSSGLNQSSSLSFISVGLVIVIIIVAFFVYWKFLKNKYR